MIYFKQCRLSSNNTWKTVWIPEKFCHVGKRILIEDQIWLVEKVFDERKDLKYIEDRELDYKYQRKASDI